MIVVVDGEFGVFPSYALADADIIVSAALLIAFELPLSLNDDFWVFRFRSGRRGDARLLTYR